MRLIPVQRSLICIGRIHYIDKVRFFDNISVQIKSCERETLEFTSPSGPGSCGGELF